MRVRQIVRPRRLKLLLGVLLAMLSIPLIPTTARAGEKFSIATSAELVVVGQLRATTTLPWVSGWRIRGAIYPDQVLFGSESRKPLRFEFVCSCCPWWPPPDVSFVTQRGGLWFLKRAGEMWVSAGSCSDPGFRQLEGNADLIEYTKGRAR
jgi:hypothetical protein